MPVEVIRSGEIGWDTERAAKVIAPLVVGRIKRRTARGVDANDRPFAPYSPGYQKALVAIGEGLQVDLHLTGGMMGAVHVAAIEVALQSVIITVGLRPTTSPQIDLPPTHWGDDAIQDWLDTHGGGKASRTGRRGPPHNQLGGWIHRGTERAPARPFLRLSPADRKWIRGTLLDALRGSE